MKKFLLISLVRVFQSYSTDSFTGRVAGAQRVYRGEGFSALFTFCPNCPAIISPRILGKIGAVVGVPRACQKFWGFFCLVGVLKLAWWLRPSYGRADLADAECKQSRKTHPQGRRSLISFCTLSALLECVTSFRKLRNFPIFLAFSENFWRFLFRCINNTEKSKQIITLLLALVRSRRALFLLNFLE